MCVSVYVCACAFLCFCVRRVCECQFGCLRCWVCVAVCAYVQMYDLCTRVIRSIKIVLQARTQLREACEMPSFSLLYVHACAVASACVCARPPVSPHSSAPVAPRRAVVSPAGHSAHVSGPRLK